jgi:hypothetical protein
MPEPGKVPCGIFNGVSGKLVAISLTLLAFLTYIISFTCRRGRTDFRSWRVFWLDLAKMGIGQVTLARSRHPAMDADHSWYGWRHRSASLRAVCAWWVPRRRPRPCEWARTEKMRFGLRADPSKHT